MFRPWMSFGIFLLIFDLFLHEKRVNGMQKRVETHQKTAEKKYENLGS